MCVCAGSVYCAVQGSGQEEGGGIHYQFSISNGDCPIGSDILEPDQHHRFTRPAREPKPPCDADYRDDNIFSLSTKRQPVQSSTSRLKGGWHGGGRAHGIKACGRKRKW